MELLNELLQLLISNLPALVGIGVGGILLLLAKKASGNKLLSSLAGLLRLNKDAAIAALVSALKAVLPKKIEKKEEPKDEEPKV